MISAVAIFGALAPELQIYFPYSRSSNILGSAALNLSFGVAFWLVLFAGTSNIVGIGNFLTRFQE